MQELDLTNIPPENLTTAEAEKIRAILPKLAGLKKIIQVTEARAKELLTEDPEVFDGDWILKEGAIDRRIVDQEAFVTSMLELQSGEEYPITAKDLLDVATFPVGKAEKLIMDKFNYAKKMAAGVLEQMGEDVVKIGRKAPTLKDNRK